eukprot:g1575.t1
MMMQTARSEPLIGEAEIVDRFLLSASKGEEKIRRRMEKIGGKDEKWGKSDKLAGEIRTAIAPGGNLYNWAENHGSQLITMREFKKGIQMGGIRAEERSIMRFFEIVDRDLDGMTTWKEIRAAVREPSMDRLKAMNDSIDVQTEDQIINDNLSLLLETPGARSRAVESSEGETKAIVLRALRRTERKRREQDSDALRKELQGLGSDIGLTRDAIDRDARTIAAIANGEERAQMKVSNAATQSKRVRIRETDARLHGLRQSLMKRVRSLYNIDEKTGGELADRQKLVVEIRRLRDLIAKTEIRRKHILAGTSSPPPPPLTPDIFDDTADEVSVPALPSVRLLVRGKSATIEMASERRSAANFVGASPSCVGTPPSPTRRSLIPPKSGFATSKVADTPTTSPSSSIAQDRSPPPLPFNTYDDSSVAMSDLSRRALESASAYELRANEALERAHLAERDAAQCDARAESLDRQHVELVARAREEAKSERFEDARKTLAHARGIKDAARQERDRASKHRVTRRDAESRSRDFFQAAAEARVEAENIEASTRSIEASVTKLSTSAPRVLMYAEPGHLRLDDVEGSNNEGRPSSDVSERSDTAEAPSDDSKTRTTSSDTAKAEIDKTRDLLVRARRSKKGRQMTDAQWAQFERDVLRATMETLKDQPPLTRVDTTTTASSTSPLTPSSPIGPSVRSSPYVNSFYISDDTLSLETRDDDALAALETRKVSPKFYTMALASDWLASLGGSRNNIKSDREKLETIDMARRVVDASDKIRADSIVLRLAGLNPREVEEAVAFVPTDLSFEGAEEDESENVTHPSSSDASLSLDEKIRRVRRTARSSIYEAKRRSMIREKSDYIAKADDLEGRGSERWREDWRRRNTVLNEQRKDSSSDAKKERNRAGHAPVDEVTPTTDSGDVFFQDPPSRPPELEDTKRSLARPSFRANLFFKRARGL